MKTTKPISTISYNSEYYLVSRLVELQKAKKIQFWAFIQHTAEEDEKKAHKHLYIEPAKSIQTEDIREYLKEIDEKDMSKPLGCISFNSSRFDDWFLYVLHDEKYLASKGQSRKYHYKATDIISSDEDDLEYHINEVDMTKYTPYQPIVDAQKEGISFESFIARGRVPIQHIHQYREAWYILKHQSTYRNGRENHEEKSESEIDQALEETHEEISRKHKIDREEYKQRKLDNALKKLRSEKISGVEQSNAGPDPVIPAYTGIVTFDMQEVNDDDLDF